MTLAREDKERREKVKEIEWKQEMKQIGWG